MLDATAALDDMLTERYRGCALCGQAARFMDLLLVAGLVVFAGLCARCRAQHGWAAVDALWTQRLGPGRP
jgi:hypothetical protein